MTIIGAGGHAKVVIASIQALGHPISSAWDDDERKWGKRLLGVRVSGPIEAMRFDERGVGVIAIGDNVLRKEVSERWGMRWLTVVDPRAWVHSSASLGRGTVVLPGAIVQAEASIGNFGIVNTGSTIDHDCCLDSYVHVAPGVHLAGSVALGEGVLMGIGSTVIPGCRIGSWAVAGAGSVIVNDIAAGRIVKGVPAR